MNYARTFVGLLMAIICCAWSPCSSAQEVTRFGQQRNAVRLDVGIDSAWVARLGYTRRVRLVPEYDLLVSPGLTFAVAHFDVADSLIDIPVRTSILGTRSWRLDVSFGPFVRNTTNALFRAHAIGASLHLLPGYWHTSWGLGLNVGYEQSITTYIKNSAKYRELIYAGARDGWYGQLGATWNFGAQGGILLGPVELVLRAGLLTTQRLATLTVPVYALLGGACRF